MRNLQVVQQPILEVVDPAVHLERLAALEPSTFTLVRMIHYMVRYFLLAGEADRAERASRLRLVLHSFLEDGEYARELFETIFERVQPLFAASIEAAAASIDSSPRPLATFRKSRYLRFTRSFAGLHLVTDFDPVSSAHWREGLRYRLIVAPLSVMRCRDRRRFSRRSLELRLGT